MIFDGMDFVPVYNFQIVDYYPLSLTDKPSPTSHLAELLQTSLFLNSLFSVYWKQQQVHPLHVHDGSWEEVVATAVSRRLKVFLAKQQLIHKPRPHLEDLAQLARARLCEHVSLLLAAPHAHDGSWKVVVAAAIVAPPLTGERHHRHVGLLRHTAETL